MERIVDAPRQKWSHERATTISYTRTVYIVVRYYYARWHKDLIQISC